jgi:thiopeptide-type bacteriocin biosynthesis protein
MTGTERTWQSLHLFVAAEQDLDLLVLEAGSWMANRKGAFSQPWFFIRYTEGGPHLRLRVMTADDEFWHSLKRQMSDSCSKLAGGRGPDQWAQSMTVPTKLGELFSPGQAVDAIYQPETRRYGGPEALAVHEDLFVTSSSIAFEVVRRTGHHSRARVAAAMQLMIDTLAGLSGLDADPQQFMLEYAESWKGAWEHNILIPKPAKFSLKNNYLARVYSPEEERHSSITELWLDELRRARGKLDKIAELGLMIAPIDGKIVHGDEKINSAIRFMARSQIHMLNNRLGLWPNFEIAMAEALVCH